MHRAPQLHGGGAPLAPRTSKCLRTSNFSVGSAFDVQFHTCNVTDAFLVRQDGQSHYLSDYHEAWHLHFRVLRRPKRGRADACSRCLTLKHVSIPLAVSTFICCAGTPLLIRGVLSKDASGLTIVQCEDHPSAPALIL